MFYEKDFLLAVAVSIGSTALGGLLLQHGHQAGWISLAIGLFAGFAAGWIGEQDFTDQLTEGMQE